VKPFNIYLLFELVVDRSSRDVDPKGTLAQVGLLRLFGL